MADSPLVDVDEIEPTSSSMQEPKSPSLTAAISLKGVRPTDSYGDPKHVELHARGLCFGLHVPKRYIIIGQQAGAVDSKVFLRFPLALDDLNYSISYRDHHTQITIVTKALLRHEVIYSDTTCSRLERELERESVDTDCSLPAQDYELGTKLIIEARDEDNEERLQVVVQTINSIYESRDDLQSTSDDQSKRDNTDVTTASPTIALPSPDLTLLDLSPVVAEGPDHHMQTPAVDVYDNDIWKGLEELDRHGTTPVAAAEPNIKKPVSVIKLKDLEARFYSKLKRTTSKESILPVLSISDDSPEPNTSPDELLQPDDLSLDLISLAPTRDISTIPTMPSAVIPLRENPASTRIGKHESQEAVEEITGEDGLARRWSSKATQWDAFRKPPKVRDVRTAIRSEEQPSGYAWTQGSQPGGLTGGGMRIQHMRSNADPSQSTLAEPRPDLYPVGKGKGIFGRIPERGTSIAPPRGPRADERERGRGGGSGGRGDGVSRGRGGKSRGDRGDGTFGARGGRGRGDNGAGHTRARGGRGQGSRGRGQRAESFRGHWGENEETTQDQWQWPTGYEDIK